MIVGKERMMRTRKWRRKLNVFMNNENKQVKSRDDEYIDVYIYLFIYMYLILCKIDIE